MSMKVQISDALMDYSEVEEKSEAPPSSIEPNEEWKNRVVPGRLDTQGAYSLFQKFLGKVDNPNEWFNNFIQQKVTGHVLVTATKDQKFLKELKEDLKLPSGIKVYFNDMINFIKESEEKRQSNEHQGNTISQSSNERASRKRKNSSEETSTQVVGAEVRHDKNSEGYYNHVNVKKTKKSKGHVTGIKIDSTDYSAVRVESINVSIEHSDHEAEDNEPKPT